MSGRSLADSPSFTPSQDPHHLEAYWSGKVHRFYRRDLHTLDIREGMMEVRARHMLSPPQQLMPLKAACRARTPQLLPEWHSASAAW